MRLPEGVTVVDSKLSHRGGWIEYDVSGVLPVSATMGTSQNYLGGGMLGSITCGYNFDPAQFADSPEFARLCEDLKEYHHALTRHDWDEFEDATFEQNQARPARAY